MGVKNFEYFVGQNKICVVQIVEFFDNLFVIQESVDKVVRFLFEKFVVNIVIVYVGVKYINEMFKVMIRNVGVEGKFKFIGFEIWGNNYGVILGVERLVKGFVILIFELLDIRDFDIYIGEKFLGNYLENLWFFEFYEEMVNCYLIVLINRYQMLCFF